MDQSIDYGSLMHRALRGLIDEVLSGIAINGLPGDHHFFIGFDTTHSKVKLADWLKDRYPEEMTIVIQNWFDGLKTDPDGFSITLNFGDSPETLYVPYDAIRTFVDPSVEFGLRFDSQDGDSPNDTPDQDDAPIEIEEEHDAEIVSLDTWRK